MKKIFTSEWSKKNENSNNRMRLHVFEPSNAEFYAALKRMKEDNQNNIRFTGIREFFDINVDDSMTYFSQIGKYFCVCELN